MDNIGHKKTKRRQTKKERKKRKIIDTDLKIKLMVNQGVSVPFSYKIPTILLVLSSPIKEAVVIVVVWYMDL